MRHTAGSAHRRPSPAAILLVPVTLAVILTLFAWPSARLEPRDLPIGVAGAPAAAAAIEQRLAQNEGAFDVERYPGEAAARGAIEDRDVYGAFVAAPSGAKVLTSSAASPMVAQLLSHAAVDAGGEPLPVEDVVAASPAGSAIASSVLPLVIAGILTAVAASPLRRLGVRPRRAARRRLGARRAGRDRHRPGLARHRRGRLARQRRRPQPHDHRDRGGRRRVEGPARPRRRRHRGADDVGNPFAAVGSAPELLPQPVGGIGQLLPLGAGGNLLRSTGFFDGAGGGRHAVVLGCWVLAGLGLLFAAGLRDRRRGAVTAVAEPALAY